MSSNKQNLIGKPRTENGISSPNLEKDLLEEKENNMSNLTNIKVFNGLIREEKDIFKNLNNKNDNKNAKNKKDRDSFLNDEKNIDLNYISFGDCDNLFVNNLTKESNKIEKKEYLNKDINNNYENKKKQKNNVEERLLNNKNNKTKYLNNEFMPNQNVIKNKNLERNQTKNYFIISELKKGQALVVTNDDIIFSLPACLLPKETKLGDNFSLEIKLFNNNLKKKELEEIGNVQKKYSKIIIDGNQESK